MDRPTDAEYAPLYAGYVALVPETELLGVLEAQREELARVAAAAGDGGHRYAPGKWSVRELLGHVVDAERVFGYRAFCISRGETAALPGFDEKLYVSNAPRQPRAPAEIALEFAAVRHAQLLGLVQLGPDDWLRTGTASGVPVSVRALGFIMAGHVRHHLGVLRTRYGIA